MKSCAKIALRFPEAIGPFIDRWKKSFKQARQSAGLLPFSQLPTPSIRRAHIANMSALKS